MGAPLLPDGSADTAEPRAPAHMVAPSGQQPIGQQQQQRHTVAQGSWASAESQARFGELEGDTTTPTNTERSGASATDDVREQQTLNDNRSAAGHRAAAVTYGARAQQSARVTESMSPQQNEADALRVGNEDPLGGGRRLRKSDTDSGQRR